MFLNFFSRSESSTTVKVSSNASNSSISSSSIDGDTADVPRKKGVCFSNQLKVVLIPSRGEYKSAGLNPNLWWTSAEFKEFQKTSNSEILLMAKYENIDVRSARRKLYQPGNGCDEKQFEMIQQACAPSSSAKDNIFDDYYFQEMDDINDEQELDNDGELQSITSPGLPKHSSSKIPPHSPKPRHGSQLQGNDDDDSDEHDLHSIALLYPVSSLNNLSRNQSIEEIDMYFGNWEGDDDLSLCVEVPGQSLDSFEQMHQAIQNDTANNRRQVQHKAAGPSSVSTGIAVASAVMLALVVLTGT